MRAGWVLLCWVFSQLVTVGSVHTGSGAQGFFLWSHYLCPTVLDKVLRHSVLRDNSFPGLSHWLTALHAFFPVAATVLILGRTAVMLAQRSPSNSHFFFYFITCLEALSFLTVPSWGLGGLELHQRNQHGGFTVHCSYYWRDFPSSQCGNVWKK